ncbi:MAG: universal stress protein [Kofleriaceae bacterium]
MGRPPRRHEVAATSDFLVKAARAIEILRGELPACCQPPGRLDARGSTSEVTSIAASAPGVGRRVALWSGMTFRKILCPVDFSPGSHTAMRAAVRIAIERGAELVLVHAWYLPPVATGGEAMLSADRVQQLSDDAQLALDDEVQAASALGAKRVTQKLLNGVPWTVITDAAREDIDLIVIGTHGRTGLARILIGSVAEKVVRHAPCPVLVVRPDGAVSPFTHVLCPVDFSASAHEAMELAGQLAQPGGAGITLLHVIEVPVAYSGEPNLPGLYRDLDQLSVALLEEWAKELRTTTSVPVTPRCRIGHPGAGTLAVLDADATFDLVVMGSRGRTGMARALLGSVAEKVVRHARCPVLVSRSRH